MHTDNDVPLQSATKSACAEKELSPAQQTTFMCGCVTFLPIN